MLRTCAISFSVVALLAGSVNQSKAAAAIIPPPVAAGGAATAGAWVAGGFIGVVAALCIYDIWLKVDGQKNWDGTAMAKTKPTGKVKIHDISITKTIDKSSPGLR